MDPATATDISPSSSYLTSTTRPISEMTSNSTDQVSEFLSCLPEETPKVIASTLRAVNSALQQNLDADGNPRSEYVVVSYVGPQVVEQLVNNRGVNMRMFYDEELRTLIVKLPMRPHEILIQRFNYMFLRESERQGDEESIDATGSETVEESPYAKEGDSGFLPRRFIPGRDPKWPTVVLEVGLSQGLEELRRCARWWLGTSNGLVKVVIIASIHRTQPQIIFEKWKLQPVQPNHPYGLRILGPGTPAKIQEITIFRRNNTTVTTGAPLVVQFEHIFLTPPSGTQQDYIFTAKQLEGIAERVWEKQRFVPMPI
ncbi:hypothetical protein ASPWEDRAFT_395583 [Aspergillus wentii DTO 134E9]|uniref:Uncharacterized protein n=1 Tax=Aspergillus wentii DTO 134E9 TaxID=1073089 RepID=A0A1L9RXW7_ASPWE|nr:uncharacterized protein ASPWEDRAFT_395583 [Aspergillus wentii DTO 134E9]KAI9931540.1 hypothetical protein MW887_010117 [Aspergillus wentii]OJJ39791.1 hypothetical protein ASPWEDRAFT_395583 [Aspergillus wentii DTO 134E9]